MTQPSTSGFTPDPQAPIWLDWVFSNTQTGLLLLDRSYRVVLANKWILMRAGLDRQQVTGKLLTDVFPMLSDTHFERVLTKVVTTGFPAILSQTLHPAPFPLYANAAVADKGQPLRQSIQIVPMGPADTKVAGERYTLVQISDVTSNVLRENLLRAQTEKMSLMAMYDSLTGLGNRRAFDDWLASEIRVVERSMTSLALMFIDIDHFKLFNDAYGHPAGDVCLRQVADSIRGICMRPRDRVARYGGEELVVILPDTDAQGAQTVAEQVLQAVQDLAIPHATSPVAPHLTLSIGIAVMDPKAPGSAKELLAQADAAVYRAKNAGRNQVCYQPQEPVAPPPAP